MDTVTEPTVPDVGQAILAFASPTFTHNQERLDEIAAALLPYTPRPIATKAILDVQDFTRRAEKYATADPELAYEWFGDICGCDKDSLEGLAQCLQDRSAVWYGEAETLALSAALRDRTVHRAAVSA